jgi:hypothetical protein
MRFILSRATMALATLLLAFIVTGPTTAEAAGSGCLPGVLKQRLSEIRARFGPVSIISSHRPGARVAGSGRRSLHADCRAVDFKPSGNYSAVVAYLKANHNGGVGTYSCGMNHIHIDAGPMVRFHKCVSASGRSRGGYRTASRRRSASSRRYASNSGQYRSSRRASRSMSGKRRYTSTYVASYSSETPRRSRKSRRGTTTSSSGWKVVQSY